MPGYFNEGFLHLDTRILSKHHINRKWSELNRLGNSRLLRSSWAWLAIVPIVAKALSNVDEIGVPFLGEDFRLKAELPFSWHIFFFSSLAFGIASLLYTLFCPAIVQRYQKLSVLLEHVESEEAAQTEIVHAYCDALANRHRAFPSEIQGRIDSFVSRYGKKNSSKEETVHHEQEGHFRIDISAIELDLNLFPDSFRAARSEADQMRRSVRAICWYLYLVGFSLLSIVLLENLYFVSSSFVAYWGNGNTILNYLAAFIPILIGGVMATIYFAREN